jgi:hypothetical protein
MLIFKINTALVMRNWTELNWAILYFLNASVIRFIFISLINFVGTEFIESRTQSDVIYSWNA